MPRLLADLEPIRRYPNFRRLWVGLTISNIGSQVTVVAVAYQTYTITHSTVMVGLIGLVQLVPLLIGSLWGGSLVDAMDRRTVIAIAQIALGLSSAGLVANSVFRHPSLAVIFVCVALSAGFQAVDWSSRSSISQQLLPVEQRANAAALLSIVRQISFIVGPALAGVLIATTGVKAAYGLDTASFVVVLLTALLLPRLEPAGGGTPVGFSSVIEGLRYAKRNRFLVSLLVIDLNAMVFGMPKAVFPALGLSYYHGGAKTVGLLYAAPGIGSFVASLLSGWVAGVYWRGRAVVICLLIWGVAITIVGIAPILWLGVVLLAVAGGADIISGVFRTTIWQTTVPQRLQGRLTGLFYASAVSGNTIGDGEAGAASAIDGPTFAVWSGGIACLVGIALTIWRFPEIWRDPGHAEVSDISTIGSPSPSGTDSDPRPEAAPA